MNPLTATHPAPDWLRELATARTRYEELLGWPVCMDVLSQCVAVPVGMVLDTVTMPAILAQKVRVELGFTMPAGPVAADPDGDWWTFLTEPATAARHDIPAELRELEVHTARHGAHVVIPTRLDGTDDRGWRWVELPHPHQSLPPWSAVLGATRRIAAGLVSTGR
jgi:hypothetical protein